MSLRSRVPLGVTLAGFALVQWLRRPEPLGLDQSLFALYGRWLPRGMTLYHDLWDSKPPGLFWLYALADRAAGALHAAWGLDLAAALLAAALAARLAHDLAQAAAFTPADRQRAGFAAAVCGLFVWSAPVFGGPYVAGQAEVCMAPLVLAAALAARRTSARAAVGCGVLLGAAAMLKLVALFALPLAWLFAAPPARRDWRRAGGLALGVALPAAITFGVLVAQHTLGEALQAVLVYPRAYAAEIAARSPWWEVLRRGGARLGHGLPFLLILAAAGLWSVRRRAPGVGGALGAWLALAAVAVTAQRQMAGYHLLFLAPPLCVLAGLGAPALGAACTGAWRGTQHGSTRAGLGLAVLALALTAVLLSEARLWIRQYAPHVKYRRGEIDRRTFLSELGGPGPLWSEAEAVADSMRAVPVAAGAGSTDAARRATMLVWGLAPSLYLLGDARPVSRYAFHQTLLVPDSPLSQRWPDANARRMELLTALRRDPPDWIVIVHGDRSGLEPEDSAAELLGFPSLREFLAREYRPRARTNAYELRGRAAD